MLYDDKHMIVPHKYLGRSRNSQPQSSSTHPFTGLLRRSAVIHRQHRCPTGSARPSGLPPSLDRGTALAELNFERPFADLLKKNTCLPRRYTTSRYTTVGEIVIGRHTAAFADEIRRQHAIILFNFVQSFLTILVAVRGTTCCNHLLHIITFIVYVTRCVLTVQ